jgi:hypothetical protein
VGEEEVICCARQWERGGKGAEGVAGSRVAPGEREDVGMFLYKDPSALRCCSLAIQASGLIGGYYRVLSGSMLRHISFSMSGIV